MDHAGNALALTPRDSNVHKAVNSDAHRSGEQSTAIVAPFIGNLLYAAIPQTIAGLSVVLRTALSL